MNQVRAGELKNGRHRILGVMLSVCLSKRMNWPNNVGLFDFSPFEIA